MHYCENCGTQLEDEVYTCPYCGHQNKRADEPKKEIVNEDHINNGFAIAGFILSLLVPVFGIIFSAIGLGVGHNYKRPYRRLAAAGLTIGIVFSLFGLFALILM
ncbi:MAG: zinc-ribbon domain-containing protein [Coprobacillus sp.]|nr:zinc-ribbon domain-containing protein [Coprobacillus sp.]